MERNVLIVDDVLINRKIIRGILLKKVEEVQIIEAENGFKAMDIINSKKISVVILDIMMPGKDGLQVLAEIKENPEMRNLPVIMCSAVHETNSVEKALSIGALDYFTKPLSEEQMKITLPLKVKNALEYYQNKSELVTFYERIRDEMQLAEQVQKALISEYLEYDSAKMWGKYIPYEEIGGDIFCFKQIKDKYWFMIADISGHGISAAMISTMLNVIFNTTVDFCNEPDDILKKINMMLFEVFGGSKNLISAFAGVISGNTLSYANAGHPYPLIFRNKTKMVEWLEAKGFLLGIFEKVEFSIEKTDISESDMILLYTDGLFDKGVNNGFSNWDAVKVYCERNIDNMNFKESAFLDSMLNEFSSADEKEFIDDVAIMLIKKFKD